VPDGHGVLLRTRSVHGFGLAAPLGLVVVGPDGLVLDVRILRPGRVVWLESASLVAELPWGWPLPRRGGRLRAGAPRT
jgi:hypothetical protein